MVQRPAAFNAFEFVVLAGLRAAQLMRGCTPRVESTHKVITTAQMEVAGGMVVRAVHAAAGAQIGPVLSDEVRAAVSFV